jgi:Fe-S-cluster containining protein
VPDDGPLPAGRFADWLDGMERALSGERDSDVPCNGCTACCKSSHFVHIDPDELDTLAHLPAALLFPAPGLPEGHVVLGYDENGHCPMLVDDKCSIYEHRPRTCRTYDCRIFTATGVDVDEDKPAIAHRVARWRFDFLDALDQEQYAAVQTMAVQIGERPNGMQQAVLAIEVHQEWVEREKDCLRDGA